MGHKKAVTSQPATGCSNLLTDAQAAAYLGVKSRTLRLWRRARGLPHFKLTAKEIRYRQTDLDSWLNRHRVAIAA